MRTEITDEDEQLVIQMYSNRNSINSIANKTGYSVEAVKNILSSNKKNIKTLKGCRRSHPFKLHNVITLYNRGYPVENIHKILNFSYQIIWSVLEENGFYEFGCGYRGATVDKVNAFAETVSAGDVFEIVTPRDKDFDNIIGNYTRAIKIKILKKFPHIVVTDNGDFTYLDLFSGRRL